MAKAATVKRLAKQTSGQDGRRQQQCFSADEFDADTQEDRSISVLAEKRRQFLARLHAEVGTG